MPDKILLQNKYLYVILWGAGILISGVIISMWNTDTKNNESTNLFGEYASELSTDKASANIVNDLLLSARDLNISGETSLIDLTNKNVSSAEMQASKEMKSDPARVYKEILNKKLQKLGVKPVRHDFYIKAVPK
jgi:hypothetical protein